jgi:hypothetical protein
MKARERWLIFFLVTTKRTTAIQLSGDTLIHWKMLKYNESLGDEEQNNDATYEKKLSPQFEFGTDYPTPLWNIQT